MFGERQFRFFHDRWSTVWFMIVPVMLLYVRTLDYDFTSLDEQWLILNKERALQSPAAIGNAFRQPMLGVYYRPLMQLTLVMDYSLYGLQPWGYHLTNLLCHLCALLLLYRLLRLYGVTRPPAAVLTLTFGLHPVHLHAVAWIPGRNDSLLAIFALASMNFLLMWLQSKKSKHLLTHLFCFACALLSKENAVLLPLVYLLLMYSHRSWTGGGMLLPGWILLAACWLFGWTRAVPAGSFSPGVSWDHLAAFGKSLLVYTGKIFIPFRQSVLPTVGEAVLWPGIVTVIVIAALFTGARFHSRKKAIAGLLIFFLLLVLPLWIMSGRTRGELYEHRAYLPLTGIVLLVSQIRPGIKTMQLGILAAVIGVFYFAKSFLRMPVYKNEKAFVETGLKESPDYPAFYQQKGTMLLLAEDYKACIPYFDSAIARRPDLSRLHLCRGLAHYNLHQSKPAIRDLTRAMELSGPNPYLHMNRMLAYWQDKDLRGTVRDMTALNRWKGEYDLSPEGAKVAQRLTDTLNGLKARADSEPGNVSLNDLMGDLYREIGRQEKSAFYTRRARVADSLSRIFSP